MSVSRFSRIVQRATGKSFIIARAQKLLEESEIPVAQIAYEVGFASQSYFGLMFRREAGMTPGRYRDLVRAGETAQASSVSATPGGSLALRR